MKLRSITYRLYLLSYLYLIEQCFYLTLSVFLLWGPYLALIALVLFITGRAWYLWFCDRERTKAIIKLMHEN